MKKHIKIFTILGAFIFIGFLPVAVFAACGCGSGTNTDNLPSTASPWLDVPGLQNVQTPLSQSTKAALDPAVVGLINQINAAGGAAKWAQQELNSAQITDKLANSLKSSATVLAELNYFAQSLQNSVSSMNGLAKGIGDDRSVQLFATQALEKVAVYNDWITSMENWSAGVPTSPTQWVNSNGLAYALDKAVPPTSSSVIVTQAPMDMIARAASLYGQYLAEVRAVKGGPTGIEEAIFARQVQQLGLTPQQLADASKSTQNYQFTGAKDAELFLQMASSIGTRGYYDPKTGNGMPSNYETLEVVTGITAPVAYGTVVSVGSKDFMYNGNGWTNLSNQQVATGVEKDAILTSLYPSYALLGQPERELGVVYSAGSWAALQGQATGGRVTIDDQTYTQNERGLWTDQAGKEISGGTLEIVTRQANASAVSFIRSESEKGNRGFQTGNFMPGGTVTANDLYIQIINNPNIEKNGQTYTPVRGADGNLTWINIDGSKGGTISYAEAIGIMADRYTAVSSIMTGLDANGNRMMDKGVSGLAATNYGLRGDMGSLNNQLDIDLFNHFGLDSSSSKAAEAKALITDYIYSAGKTAAQLGTYNANSSTEKSLEQQLINDLNVKMGNTIDGKVITNNETYEKIVQQVEEAKAMRGDIGKLADYLPTIPTGTNPANGTNATITATNVIPAYEMKDGKFVYNPNNTAGVSNYNNYPVNGSGGQTSTTTISIPSIGSIIPAYELQNGNFVYNSNNTAGIPNYNNYPENNSSSKSSSGSSGTSNSGGSNSGGINLNPFDTDSWWWSPIGDSNNSNSSGGSGTNGSTSNYGGSNSGGINLNPFDFDSEWWGGNSGGSGTNGSTSNSGGSNSGGINLNPFDTDSWWWSPIGDSNNSNSSGGSGGFNGSNSSGSSSPGGWTDSSTGGTWNAPTADAPYGSYTPPGASDSSMIELYDGTDFGAGAFGGSSAGGSSSPSGGDATGEPDFSNFEPDYGPMY